MGTFVAAGFVAHKFKYFDLLALYPYRVAAVTWPLISAIYFSNLLLHSWRKRQVILSKKLLLSFFLSVIVILIPLTYAFYGWISDTPKLLEGTKGNAQKIDDNKTYAWIKNHTPIDSVVLANPCRGDFWFSAERAMVVNFKLTPVNINYHEWYRRMFTLNRSKDFAGNGFGACADLDQNFNALSEEQLKNIQLLYRTDYYLSDIERLDLYRCLVFRGEVNFIYDLAVCDIRAKIE
ncbi:MAG: hypothetical protein H8E09_00685 [Gammaproteobacteria bacterium]|nr:hypothetical protein [Gammaproteobacteria bacterium]